MVRPRRAARPPRWPYWLRSTFILLWIALIGFSVAYAVQHPEADATPTTVVVPRPGPTVQVSVMPFECHDMLEAADAVYDASTSSEQASLKAATLAAEGAQEQNPAKLIAAGKAIEEAQKWQGRMKTVRANFLKQYKECSTR